jgi:hypothetical protein
MRILTDDKDFFFPDLNPAEDGIVPVPPEEMRLLDVRAEPYPEGGRIRVFIETTAFNFKQRPYLDLTLLDDQGEEVAAASIIEPMNRKMEFTLHSRSGQKTGSLTLTTRLFYPEMPDRDRREIRFAIPDQGSPNT